MLDQSVEKPFAPLELYKGREYRSCGGVFGFVIDRNIPADKSVHIKIVAQELEAAAEKHTVKQGAWSGFLKDIYLLGLIPRQMAIGFFGIAKEAIRRRDDLVGETTNKGKPTKRHRYEYNRLPTDPVIIIDRVNGTMHKDSLNMLIERISNRCTTKSEHARGLDKSYSKRVKVPPTPTGG